MGTLRLAHRAPCILCAKSGRNPNTPVAVSPMAVICRARPAPGHFIRKPFGQMVSCVDSGDDH